MHDSSLPKHHDLGVRRPAVVPPRCSTVLLETQSSSLDARPLNNISSRGAATSPWATLTDVKDDHRVRVGEWQLLARNGHAVVVGRCLLLVFDPETDGAKLGIC